MDWKNAFVDNAPSDKQEVLISVGGINFIATYNKHEHGFQIRNSKKFIRITPENSVIYWMEIPHSL